MKHPSANSPLSLIGVPLDLGAKNLGVDMGPNAFRYQNLIAKLARAGLTVTDEGDITPRSRHTLKPGNPQLPYLDEIVRVSEASAELTEHLVRQDRHIIGLGGDHSMTLGLVSGASAALGGDLGLIYFDAHGDMNTPETSLTHNIHGMHLASLIGFGPDELTNVHTPEVKIAKNHLLHIGGCDFDQAELDLVEREHLETFMMIDLLSNSLAPLLAKIDTLAARVGHVWVSLDLDSIDSLYAPGAGMPNLGGLSYREIAAIATYIGRHTNVVGVDIVEYNPLLDKHSKTAELGIELIARFFGANYSWYTNYLANQKDA
jgi:arginase